MLGLPCRRFAGVNGGRCRWRLWRGGRRPPWAFGPPATRSGVCVCHSGNLWRYMPGSTVKNGKAVTVQYFVTCCSATQEACTTGAAQRPRPEIPARFESTTQSSNEILTQQEPCIIHVCTMIVQVHNIRSTASVAANCSKLPRSCSCKAPAYNARLNTHSRKYNPPKSELRMLH